MKPFFYATLGYMITQIVFSLHQLPALRPYTWLEHLTLLPTCLLTYALVSPYLLLKRYGERPWVGGLMLPYPVSMGVLALVNGLQIVWLQFQPYSAAFTTVINIVSICSALGVLLFIVACYCVRVQPVRRGFRLQGTVLIATLLIAIVWNVILVYGHGRIFPHLVRNLLLNALYAAGYIPLLLLNYNAWKSVEEDEWTAALAALGTDQPAP
ncbi:hypothetical protein [Dinghuibacter silviterrae]|uniref:Uncharacterized protein n=1 Tax=Dinghuibacter silviterrae TaxID=1539049 RepID=A0A4R8DWK6_9BACT|nr:hypothetical protein [Dinghuibacter silviterrae]TDX01895.1 hypothetical protein EDB95_2940 [Dinghuibacter silviterrae]